MKKCLIFLGPDITALILFTIIWITTMLFYGVRVHFVQGSTVLPSIATIFLLGLASIHHIKEHISTTVYRTSFVSKVTRILRDWLPLIYLVGVYETLREYTGIIRPTSIDATLYQWDLWIFGFEPVIWIQKFIHPFWTDYFAFMYMLYFFMPMFVAGFLYAKGQRAEFRELALSCVLCMYTGYFLYLIFPAGPPRFFEGLTFDPQVLKGLFGFYDFTQNAMDSSEHVMHHSSFPSLHTALSFLSVLHAYRYGHFWNKKVLLCINGWIAVSIWIATIYLRHHWFVDLIAGWILGWTAFVSANWIYRKWKQWDQVENA
ncbi:MAG: phosphatase PAP2 family protein [Bdellovibrionales bacterium]|nr:phosphatase PAP2 family protein [Bdellovibrionales bacterium]